MRVVAVVVTYNRKDLLAECLDALARQTAPLAEVLVVDNASTDGTEQVAANRPGVTYVRLERNGGGAEGFHHGIRLALERDSDWLWLMDDDCEPAPDALARLLASEYAAEPDAAVLAPLVTEPGGAPLPINRGHIRAGWFFAPLVAASSGATEIEFCSFVGPLLRTAAAREIGLPRREMFIRFEDVEYLQRLRPRWRMWLVESSTIVHKDPQPVAGSNLRAMWRDYAQRIPFAQQWKRLYGFRNLIYTARTGGYMNGAQALSQFAVQVVRTLLFHKRRLRTLRLLAAYGMDGWRGRFRNVPPARWGEVATARQPLAFIDAVAMAYDSGSEPQASRPAGEPSPATPPG